MKHMKLLSTSMLALVLAGTFVSCKKTSTTDTPQSGLNQDERSLVMAAGFNENWAEKDAAGNFLIEGDIYLTKAQLQGMAGASPSHNLIVADEEHYRTFNIVATPNGTRNITVSLGSGFPAYYSTALDNALARYNGYKLKITFTRVASGGNITISGADLGASGGGCILGRASGFPDANGNPSPGFTLSTSSCATSYINSVDKADEVIAHEMGHCIGFRHTDYKKRSSCGPGPGESAGTIGAVLIPGTPSNVSGSYNSWMMACTNGSPLFGAADVTALDAVY